MQINIEKLRKDLIDYYGTATFGGFPAAIMDLSKIERATYSELIQIAQQNGFDINKYIDRGDER